MTLTASTFPLSNQKCGSSIPSGSGFLFNQQFGPGFESRSGFQSVRNDIDRLKISFIKPKNADPASPSGPDSCLTNNSDPASNLDPDFNLISFSLANPKFLFTNNSNPDSNPDPDLIKSDPFSWNNLKFLFNQQFESGF
jgi:hypothetical protein